MIPCAIERCRVNSRVDIQYFVEQLFAAIFRIHTNLGWIEVETFGSLH